MKIKWLTIAAPALVLAILFVVARPARSYLTEGTGSGNTFTPSAWPASALPLQWSINPTRSSAIVGNTAVTPVMTNSFSTWTNAPNASVSVGTPATSTINNDQVPAGVNLVCFVCTGPSLNFSNTDGTLALTVTSSNSSGQITQGDIFFNPSPGITGQPICFVTDGVPFGSNPCTVTNPVTTPQDLQTIATHEIGHFFGMDHSAIVSAVMYPFAPTQLTTLSYDDVAAISFLYPKATPDVATGTISGAVTNHGAGVFGAHVFANSNTTADPFAALPSNFSPIRKTPIGTLSFPNGNYQITGLPPDSYVVIAEPLDGPVTDSNVDWAGNWGQSAVQSNFTTRWH